MIVWAPSEDGWKDYYFYADAIRVGRFSHNRLQRSTPVAYGGDGKTDRFLGRTIDCITADGLNGDQTAYSGHDLRIIEAGLAGRPEPRLAPPPPDRLSGTHKTICQRIEGIDRYMRRSSRRVHGTLEQVFNDVRESKADGKASRAILESAARSGAKHLLPAPTDGKSFKLRDVLKQLTITSATWNKYARLAGVAIAGRGKGGHRCTSDEIVRVLTVMADQAHDELLCEKARVLREDLAGDQK